eukprot:Hpha_TRINITY_DN17041_c0_g1::TRINITY_DN17041_c0_g1_i1::g.166553::m.166553/K20784/XEG113; arabinosyltransferase
MPSVVVDRHRPQRHGGEAELHAEGSRRCRTCGFITAFLLVAVLARLSQVGYTRNTALPREPPPAASPSAPPPVYPTLATPRPSSLALDLSPATLRRLAGPGGVLTLTFANRFALDMVLNWHAHVMRIGITEYLVAATDTELLTSLRDRGVQAALFTTEMPSGQAKWGSQGFMAMGRTKGALVSAVLAAGVGVLFVDADCVILRNPIEYLRSRGDVDVLIHSDTLAATRAPEEGLEEPKRALGADLNTGFFWMKANDATRRAVGDWVGVMKDDEFWTSWRNDQTGFNQVMRKGLVRDDGSDIVLAAGGTVRLGILPVHLFCSGHTFFVQRLPERFNVQAYAVHVTFVNCDSPGKRHRLREEGLWLVDGPEYKVPESGLLVYDSEVPKEMREGFAATPNGRPVPVGSSMVQRHFELVHHQLQQLRTALALALLSNRTLVLPRLLCGLETVPNFAHSGLRCPSCGPQLPYRCPADHVLRIHYWVGSPPSGPRPRLTLPFRESGFLDEGRGVPRRVVNDRVRIERSGRKGSEAFGPPLRPRPKHDAEKLPSLISRATVKRLTNRVGAAALWDVGSLVGVTVDLGELSEAFEETTKWLPGGWCCAQPPPSGKGHYFYDMWADVLPHTDRWGRQYRQSFMLEPGP